MTQKSAKFELMLPKGMRDRDPGEKMLQLQVLDTIREVFELYGYSPLETPIVERMEILTAKFAAGEGTDVSKEIFTVQDQGDRDLGLRFDHTVPLCRYVAMNGGALKMPFKRYVMGRVFRDGPIKLGRYREFWQADADIIGVPGTLAEAEGVLLAAEVFKRLDLDVSIYFNSMELLKAVLKKVGVKADHQDQAIIAIDKLKKIGVEGVLSELKEAGVDAKVADELLDLLAHQGSNQERLDHLAQALGDEPSLQDIARNLEHFADLPQVIFDPSLARGLAYYTGFFFESFLNNSQISSSLTGTGRYDKMISQFSSGKVDEPGVGISFGVSVICDALREKGVEPAQTPTQVYLVPVSENERAYTMGLAQMLRQANIPADMDLMGRSIGKNFGYADALGIPYVVVVGEDEAAEEACTLKDLSSGSQETVARQDLVKILQEHLDQR